MRQALGPGALGRPRGIRWRGRWEGGIGMGNTCKPMAVSFQCMTKFTTNKKKKEATVRTGYGTIDCFQIRKGVHRGCILSSCLLNLYGKYIMRKAGLDEAQAGIKIAGRNTNNLRYADDTIITIR